MNDDHDNAAADKAMLPVHVDSLRMRYSPHGFTGFANGVSRGDIITIEFWGDLYRVRVTKCATVSNCVTPYIEMETL
jgi:hypothetical protein